jgi:hypothetical protein
LLFRIIPPSFPQLIESLHFPSIAPILPSNATQAKAASHD